MCTCYGTSPSFQLDSASLNQYSVHRAQLDVQSLELLTTGGKARFFTTFFHYFSQPFLLLSWIERPTPISVCE